MRTATRCIWNIAALAVALGILALTLVPEGRSGGPTDLGLGPPSIADALRNLALFAPLALALALAGHRGLVTVLLCTGLSAIIELLQLGIPGRIGSPADIACNAAGAALTLLLLATHHRWVAPPPGAAPWLRAGTLCAVWATVLATGALFAVEIPEGQYYGGWTSEIGGRDRYSGRILAARLGSAQIAEAGAVADSAALGAALRAREPLSMAWLAGEAPARLAPLVILIGPESEELALVAARGPDLVVRYWRHAARFLIEQPELAAPGALAGIVAGSRVELVATRTASGVALALAGREPLQIGLGPGRGWALLAPDRWVAPGLRPALDALWLAILLLPVGLWLPPGWRGLTLAGLALAALWLPAEPLGLEPATGLETCGALIGLASGRGWAFLARRQTAPVPAATR